MFKKTLTAILASSLVLASVAIFPAQAAETVYYVEQGATGVGTDDDPFGTLEEAIGELNGKDGKILVYGSYDITKFSLEWEGNVVIEGVTPETSFTLQESGGAMFYGDVEFRNCSFDLGKNTHFNALGKKFVYDPGDEADFASFIHCSGFGNSTLEECYFVHNSGKISRIDFGGAYCTSYANGVMGDTTYEINGGSIGTFRIAADSYQENMTGISVGGNANIIVNGGTISQITTREATQMEVMGALNIIFNNGMQKPETFDYPTNAVCGTYIIMSGKGGMVMPTADAGTFKIKADAGKVAVIDGEQVLNGTVALEAGEINVEWVAFDGEQPAEEEAPKEEPIEIKLTIGKAEIIKNGEATKLDVPAQIIDSRTMVPLRAIFEALGASVEWDDATKTVTSEKGDTKVSLTIGKAAITVNGEDKALDVAAQIVESRTLVPVRAIAEAYGCDVAWDDATKTVTITK